MQIILKYDKYAAWTTGTLLDGRFLGTWYEKHPSKESAEDSLALAQKDKETRIDNVCIKEVEWWPSS